MNHLRPSIHLLALLAATAWLVSCSSTTFDSYEESQLLDPVPDEGKADGPGVPGLSSSVTGGYNKVWEVKNQWTDTHTAEALKEGIAWPANSGLNWDQKFSAWITSLKKIDAHENDYRKTFELSTPWGKKVPAPSMDCADVWIFLRATFSAWYQLPFFMEGWDKGRRVFFGHFGIRTSGGPWNGLSSFGKYQDYSGMPQTMTSEQLIANWPRDSSLRRLSVIEKDEQPFIGPDARTGAYLDEVHLNKKAGHFIRILLLYTGTYNLADPRNTFNLIPSGIRQGDALLYRRAAAGSGHTMVVLQMGKNAEDKTTVQVASGDVPPRQPKWESETASRYRFLSNEGGGPTANSKGEVYSHLGGGLKRWRVAINIGGRWTNTFMPGDEAFWINSKDYDTLGARIEQFEQFLGEVTPQEKRDTLLQMIADARRHLEQYPASCAARIRREDAFSELYGVLNSYDFEYMDKKAVDRKYRVKADYVLAELVYEKSKTCCWNSSTSVMYDIIMEYAESLEQSPEECVPPPVFMAQNGGYDAFASYAANTGRWLKWKPWSADEGCPQANVINDTEAEHTWTSYCETFAPEPEPEDADGSPSPSDGGVMTADGGVVSSDAGVPTADAGVPTADGGMVP